LPCPLIVYGTVFWTFLDGAQKGVQKRREEEQKKKDETWKTLELLPFVQQPAQSFAFTLQQD
jgi:hypothetical protein